ncbi:MAG: acyl-CoA thioester hydrolase [Proteobacteria bacterium]|nr:MAG: acyl-CoA thioester hydrolase [Pseudomonadota bacterium]
MQVRVYYEDTDSGKVVYHSNYFKFCERSRSETFWQNGLEVEENGCGFLVKKILYADFIKPAKLGDLLDITCKITSHKKTSFVVHHDIFRDGEKIFETDLLAVYLCGDGRPSRIPQEKMDFLLSL